MPFKPGHRKLGGRKKGVPNKYSKETRDLLEELIRNNWPQIDKDLNQVAPKERLGIFIKLLEFVLPKAARIDMYREQNIMRWFNSSDDELRSRIHYLNKKVKENDE